MRIRDALRTDPLYHGIVPAQHLRLCEVNLFKDERGGYFLKNPYETVETYASQLGAFLALEQGSARVDFKTDLIDDSDPMHKHWVLRWFFHRLVPVLLRYKSDDLGFRTYVGSSESRT